MSAFLAIRRGARKAGAQIQDTQLHRAGPGLRVPVAVTVALDQPRGALLAVSCSGPAAHLQLHQPAQGHHLIGYRGSLGFGFGRRNPTLPGNRRCPPLSYTVVDAIVNALDLGALGFAGVDAARTGRPGYHPSALLKLYVDGYLKRVPSSRRLEREAGRNVEVMWLTGQLSPDLKTIAAFHRQNGPAIRRVCARFIALCREIDLLTGMRVAIDGSKFKAVNIDIRACRKRSTAEIIFSEQDVTMPIHRLMTRFVEADEAL